MRRCRMRVWCVVVEPEVVVSVVAVVHLLVKLAEALLGCVAEVPGKLWWWRHKTHVS